MAAAGRVPDVAAGRIIPLVVREHALEDEKLFTLRVLVAAERAAGSIAHDAGRPRDFVADAIEQNAVDPGFRR